MSSAKKSSGSAARDELIKQLDLLHDHVYQLRVNQFIFKKISQLIQENPELQNRPSHIYVWINNSYLETTAMAIRRLCDTRKGSVSMIKFLQCLKNNLSVVSRSAYKDLFRGKFIKSSDKSPHIKETIRELSVNKSYDELIGKDVVQPNKADIDQEIGDLKNIAANIKTYADERIAHFDKNPPVTLQADDAFDDMDKIIEHLTNLVIRYTRLLTANASDLNVYINYDWLAPLRVPWLSDETIIRRGFKQDQD